jgi:hypothetical protein
VAGLVLLASVGLALVVGAGLSVWRGGLAPNAGGPAVVVSPPSSGVVIVPPRPVAPAAPPVPGAPAAPPTFVRAPVPAASTPAAAAPPTTGVPPVVPVSRPPVSRPPVTAPAPRVQRVPEVVVIRVPTGHLRQVTRLRQPSEIRRLLTRLQAVWTLRTGRKTILVPVATRAHDGISRLALRSAASGAHELRARTTDVTSPLSTDADNATDADNDEQHATATRPAAVEADRHEGRRHHRAQHARGHGRHR